MDLISNPVDYFENNRAGQQPSTGGFPHNSRRAAPHPTGHRQSHVQRPHVATRVSHREVQLFKGPGALPVLALCQPVTCKEGPLGEIELSRQD